MYQEVLLRNRDPFTVSTDMLDISGNRYIDELTLSFKGDMTAAAIISVATSMGLINPFEVFLRGSPIVQINAEDLYALNLLAFGHNPFTVVATAATDDQTKIMGLKIPLWHPPRENGALKCRATRVAVAGVDTETITIAEKSSTRILSGKYLSYITRPLTTAAATGFGNRVELGRLDGSLEGILFRSATIPTNTAETASMQQVNVYVNEQIYMTREWHDLKADTKIGHHALFASPADASILDNYVYLDLKKDPIPAGAAVRLDIDAQATSSAVRVTPVIARMG